MLAAQAVALHAPASRRHGVTQQKPPRQSRPVSQGGALPPSPHWPPAAAGDRQAPATQSVPSAQSELVAQWVSQPVPASLQAKLPGHAAGWPALQCPCPSQVPPGVRLLPLQIAALHVVPATPQPADPLLPDDEEELSEPPVPLLPPDPREIPASAPQMPSMQTWPDGQEKLGPQSSTPGGTAWGRHALAHKAMTANGDPLRNIGTVSHSRRPEASREGCHLTPMAIPHRSVEARSCLS